ncbi:MAG: hypothetical protein Q8S18_15005 [Bacteroidales bacterium]|nr:hypothetical protein [Bacteroidales bacterium]
MKTDIDLLKGNPQDQYESFDLNNGALNPVSFMGLRGNHYMKDFFFPHPIYDKIKTKIIDDDLIFIIGNPLAGKTRIVYDTLSNLKKGYIVKPKLDKSIKEYRLPRRKDLVVFFDELDDYCRTNVEAMNKVLYYLIKNKIKCIATCRTGPEFNQLKKTLNAHTFSELHSAQITIPRFDKNESSVKSFLISNASQIKNIDSFDGNMGALILPLDDMRERFASLVEQDKQLPIAILKGLKLHYHLYNYESKKSFYDDSKILYFCKKYLQEDISRHEWENAKGELTTDEATLNFLDEREFIIIEEAYLDFLKNANGDTIDVIDGTLDKYKIKRLLNDTYKDLIEKKTWGFPANIHDYNRVIKKTETFEDAEKIFKDIPVGINPNEITYSLLLKKTKDKNTLERLFTEMKRRGLKFKFMPEHCFIAGFDSFDNLFESLLKLDKKSLLTRNSISNRLIELSKINPKESLISLFRIIPFGQIYTNPVYNEICLRCCKDEQDFKLYVEPYINTINKLDYALAKNFIKICSSLNQNDIALKLIEDYLKNNPFDYFNEKANCVKDAKPLEALVLYLEAMKHFTNISEQVKALTNIVNLIYDKELNDKVEFALNLASPFSQQNFTKLNFRNAQYLRYGILLLEIWRTPIANLAETIATLLSRTDISKRTFQLVIPKIKDTEKQKTVIDYFNSLLPQEDKQPTIL